MTLLLLVMLGCGTGNPIDDCSRTDIDCCERDADCRDVYGAAFPHCTSAGLTTGICSECRSETDCASNQVCEADDLDFRICVEAR